MWEEVDETLKEESDWSIISFTGRALIDYLLCVSHHPGLPCWGAKRENLDVSLRVFCFGMRLIFKLVHFESNTSSSLMWLGSTQSVRGLNRKTNIPPPRRRGFCQQIILRPEPQHELYLQFSACWPHLQSLDLPDSIIL